MEAKQMPIAGARASERIADARVAHIKVFLDREHASRLTLPLAAPPH